MPTRTRSHVNGAKAEAGALQALLSSGASINDLTKSDYGWDLHLQLPYHHADVIAAQEWSLGGCIVHVQVKSTSSSPVRLDTQLMWNRALVPTFLIVAGANAEIRFCDPYRLAKSSAWNAGQTIRSAALRPFDVTTFRELAWLAAVAPPPIMPECLVSTDWNEDYTKIVVQLARVLVADSNSHLTKVDFGALTSAMRLLCDGKEPEGWEGWVESARGGDGTTFEVEPDFDTTTVACAVLRQMNLEETVLKNGSEPSLWWAMKFILRVMKDWAVDNGFR